MYAIYYSPLVWGWEILIPQLTFSSLPVVVADAAETLIKIRYHASLLSAPSIGSLRIRGDARSRHSIAVFYNAACKYTQGVSNQLF
jgi:hypothetical protein